MPRYHSLDIEVQLCTWDPLSHLAAFEYQSTPTTQIPATKSCSTSSSRSGLNRAVPQYGYDRPHKVKRLTEECFEERKGLDFLGYDVPFFLIHAGNDSSNYMSPAEPLTGTKKSSFQGHKILPDLLEEPRGVRFPRGSSTISKALPGTPYLDSADEGGQQYQNDANEVHLSSDGSSPSTKPSKSFLSPHASDLRSEDSKVQSGNQEHTASLVTPKAAKTTADELGTLFRAQVLEFVAKPIEVIVKLSEKSFINPIFGTEKDRHDICINLFYNGEFDTSQVIEYRAWAINKTNSVFSFGGRRIGTCHERPWMIINTSKDVRSTLSPIGKKFVSLKSPERWSKLAEVFRLEANEWGSDEHGYRYPTGEYLELLSQKPMPSEIENLPASAKCGFGVIDVVITFGRVSHVDTTGLIGTPRRNLPIRQFQKTNVQVKAHFGNRTATPTPSKVTKFFSDRSNLQFPNELSSFAIGVDPTDTLISSPASEISHAITASSHQTDRISSGALGRTAPTPGIKIHVATSQAVSRRAEFMSIRNPSPLTRASTMRPPHPNKPENVPQKRYRGNDTVLPQSPPSKRQKTPSLFSELPFDLNTAAYMSTRARRSASIPSTQTPPKPQPESSIKRKRSINQVKSGLSNIDSSETSTNGTSLTPKKDEMSNPKTPESGGPLKKKPRSSNYNPKLSNRPQNLRRKNSAGEWIIPQCRRNSLGEWETPTKGGQFEAGSYERGRSDGIVGRERTEIFQPDFAVAGDKKVKSIATIQDAAHQNSPNRDKTILDENIYSDNSMEEAKKLALTVTATHNKKENILRNNSGGWSNEVVIAATASKVASSPPGTIFRAVKGPRTPVKGCQKRGLLVSSPTAAGAIAFQGYFRRQNDSVISGSNDTHQKKLLRMRFFERNIESEGEIVGEGSGNKRWQVRRCITPEYISASGSGKEHAAHPSFEMPKPKISTFITGPKGEKVADILPDGATRRSRRKPVTKKVAGLRAAKSSVGATRIASEVEIPEQLQLPATSRFVVPDYNSGVLKFAKSHPITKEKLPKEARLEASFAPQLENNDHITSPSGPAVTLAQKYGIPQRNDSEVQILLEDQASLQISADRMGPKRPLRPRTVGSTELKALLESHDRHNVVNTSLGTPLGIMHPQPLTRASRKAMSFMPRKVMTVGEVFVDTLVSVSKPAVKSSVTSDSNHKKRNSSSQLVEKTEIVAMVPKLAIGTDVCISNIVDTHTSNEINTGSSNSETNKPSQRTLKSITPETTIIATMAYEPREPGANSLAPRDTTTSRAPEKAVSRSHKVLKIPKGTMLNLGQQPVKRTDKVERAVDHIDGKSIDKPTSCHSKVKGETLYTRASNAMNVQEVTDKVDPTIRPAFKVKAEIKRVTGDLESFTTRASAQPTSQKVTSVCSGREEISTAKPAEELPTNVHGIQEQGKPHLSTLASGVNAWKPSFLSETSILTYAKDEDRDGQLCRRVGVQEEACFKEFGILMGVRYVVVGSGVIQEC